MKPMLDGDPIPTERRIEYARGYLALGMIDAASDELEAVRTRDRLTVPVLEARLELHTAARHWDIVESIASEVLRTAPDSVQGWISLGCAVRRTKGFEAARDVLLKADRLIGSKHAIVHYNLACYCSLLGLLDEAKDRLSRACKMDAHYKAMALDDDDLKPLWAAIGSME